MRSVTREDVPAIAELEMELFPGNCFNERTLSREIDAGGGVVIYDGSELIAYLLARWDWSILDITRVGVRAEHQGSGLGTKMLLDTMNSSHMDVILCAAKDNIVAVRLYHQLGFKIIGQLWRSWVMIRPKEM